LAGQALGVSHVVIFPGGACFFGYTVTAGIIPVAHGIATFGNARYLAIYRPVDPGYALRYIAYQVSRFLYIKELLLFFILIYIFSFTHILTFVYSIHI